MGPSPRLVSLVLGAKMAGPVNCRVERALGRALSSMRERLLRPKTSLVPFYTEKWLEAYP